MDDLNDLMDLNDGARELGLSAVTLRAAIKNGTLRARKFGNAWVTTRAEVDRYREDYLRRVGRPVNIPIVYGFVPWPLGAYDTKTLLLGSRRGIDEGTCEITRELASTAISEGAWQLTEVIAKVGIDASMRDFDVRGDPRAPTLIVDRKPLSQSPQVPSEPRITQKLQTWRQEIRKPERAPGD